jgi:hypothetical protein
MQPARVLHHSGTDHSCFYLCSELVTLTYEEHPGQLQQAIANLEEISMTSATVLLREKPRVGSPICMTSNGHDIFGVVLSRNYDSRLGWFITVLLDADSTWRPEWFSPQYLLAVCPCAVERPAVSKVFTLENPKITEENPLASFSTWGA